MSRRPAMIIGSGGHAHVIASFLGGADIRFVVEGPARAADQIAQTELFAGSLPDADFYIGIGNNAIRRRYFNQLTALGAALPACVAPNAWVAADAQLGRGLLIAAGAVVGARAVLGDNMIVNTLSSVDHDCVLGDDVQLTAGVTLGGDVRIGRGSYLGIKSCVLPGLTLGENVEVMAGSVVVRPAPDGVLLGGNPARVMRSADRPA